MELDFIDRCQENRFDFLNSGNQYLSYIKNSDRNINFAGYPSTYTLKKSFGICFLYRNTIISDYYHPI